MLLKVPMVIPIHWIVDSDLLNDVHSPHGLVVNVKINFLWLIGFHFSFLAMWDLEDIGAWQFVLFSVCHYMTAVFTLPFLFFQGLTLQEACELEFNFEGSLFCGLVTIAHLMLFPNMPFSLLTLSTPDTYYI